MYCPMRVVVHPCDLLLLYSLELAHFLRAYFHVLSLGILRAGSLNALSNRYGLVGTFGRWTPKLLRGLCARCHKRDVPEIYVPCL